jgi:hypothetical protein
MRRFFYVNGLSIALLFLFVSFLAAHSFSGFLEFNNQQAEHSQKGLPFTEYILSSHFWASVAENWESEFLQMGAFVFMTRFLRQRGSAESRKLKEDEEEELEREREVEDRARKAGKTPWPATKGGLVLLIYENSLWLAFILMFVISFMLHALTSYRDYKEEQLEHQSTIEPLRDYFFSSRLWFESFQNWQSEFLAILMMVTLSIFLRAKDSPESKPVGAAHSETGH